MKSLIAIEELDKGFGIRRTKWNDHVHIIKKGDYLYFSRPVGHVFKNIPMGEKAFSLEDVTATDWEIYRK